MIQNVFLLFFHLFPLYWYLLYLFSGEQGQRSCKGGGQQIPTTMTLPNNSA